MITPKIKALFQFVEYLHSNIDNFNLNNDLIKELEQLDEERQKVSSKKTYKDKLKFDEVQAEIETKFKILQGNTANLIKAKAKELNVCNFDNEPDYSFNGIETDIHQLKENFSKDDLPEIFKHKQLYIEYRTKTHKTFLSLAFFINELDKIAKSLFDYFKDTEQNEFEVFETKAIQVNDIGEAVKLFQSGKFQKFILPNNFLNPSTIQQQPNIEPLPPQQTEKPKPELKLKDFFIKEVSSDTIEAIQTEFRELEGKDLAILIYLLHKEHKIIEILTNSKTKGRKSFVKCLTETDNPSMQGVNKCFVANTDDLIYSKDDLVFQSLNKRLTKIIKK